MIEENKTKIQENSKNHTARIGYNFNREVERINEKRKEIGKKQISMNVLTNLLIKHNSWSIMFKDLIKFELKHNGK
ncbi:hypothetical protein LCGC14_1497220 [marine sediment metagenome]|uniref:Uncharacterized protein n=1 Tax=marine sediment metagenome TaxID=412755 RepID=A0A0F9LKR9_9ZZZZ